MKTTRCAPTTAAVFLVAACLALAVSGCEDAETFTGVPPPDPIRTVTPGPPANIAGAWTGTYYANAPGSCQNPSITATFEQQTSDVTATFSSSNSGGCRPPGSLTGRLYGNVLTGTANGYIAASDRFYRDAAVGGFVHPDGTLSISIATATSPRLRAQMELHR